MTNYSRNSTWALVTTRRKEKALGAMARSFPRQSIVRSSSTQSQTWQKSPRLSASSFQCHHVLATGKLGGNQATHGTNIEV